MSVTNLFRQGQTDQEAVQARRREEDQQRGAKAAGHMDGDRQEEVSLIKQQRQRQRRQLLPKDARSRENETGSIQNFVKARLWLSFARPLGFAIFLEMSWPREQPLHE
eukprot:COSAG02_NODE_470_length_21686_cov_5.095937_7_plen_108_part_00